MTIAELLQQLAQIDLTAATDEELDALHDAGEALASDVESECARRDDPDPEGLSWW